MSNGFSVQLGWLTANGGGHVFLSFSSSPPIITSISQSTEEWMKRSNPTGNVSLIRVFDNSKPAVAVAEVIRTHFNDVFNGVN